MAKPKQPSAGSTAGRSETGPLQSPQCHSWSQREKPSKMQAKFCKQCGGNISLSIPEGDQEWRHVCTNCGFIDYYNPKMVREHPDLPHPNAEAEAFLPATLFVLTHYVSLAGNPCLIDSVRPDGGILAPLRWWAASSTRGKILLCKRAIDPCRGKWTFPAGFMELHESSMGILLLNAFFLHAHSPPPPPPFSKQTPLPSEFLAEWCSPYAALQAS